MQSSSFYLHADSVLSWVGTECLSIRFSSSVLSEDVRSTRPVLETRILGFCITQYIVMQDVRIRN